MSTYSAGKVSVTPRGQYSASTQYERLDVVSDNGSSYMYINKTPATGVGLNMATHWLEIAQKGDTGLQGPEGPKGDPGLPGQDGKDGGGVPAGGTAGQVLTKIDDADQNVEWADQTGGGGGVNPNLLHNWDFRNPVNQRDVSGAISTGTYFYDRWIRNSGTVTTNADYLTIGASAEIEQRIEGNLLAGETVTVSVMVGGTVFSGTGIMPISAGTVSVAVTGWGTATLGYATGYMYVRLSPTAASNVVRVKLELCTVSTLAYDPPMDHEVELPKCQRYMLNLGVYPLAYGYASHTAGGRLYLPTPVSMRIAPTFEIPSITTLGVDGSKQSTITSGLEIGRGGVTIIFTGSGYTANRNIVAHLGQGADFMLFADL